ncbi:MAG: inositol monophosphatase [Candidatus Methanomethylophilus sp.]|nr:inositol monophosphatase [Methanomethylophilus sp.]
MDGLLEKIIAITKAAGRMMVTEKDVDIGTKGTKENYVTSTDLKIQKYLRTELTAALPGSKFLGEEEDIPDVPDSFSDEDLIWVVDPIDGTANYAHGIPMSVTAVGLVKGGEPILGVVYQPYLDEVYYAEKGKGAFRNGVPIRVSDRPKERGIVCTAWSCYNKVRAPLCFDVSQTLYGICEDIRRIGTAAYELCLLASGAADLYFEANLAPWDYTASACILREAGGVIESQYGRIRTDRNCLVIEPTIRRIWSS